MMIALISSSVCSVPAVSFQCQFVCSCGLVLGSVIMDRLGLDGSVITCGVVRRGLRVWAPSCLQCSVSCHVIAHRAQVSEEIKALPVSEILKLNYVSFDYKTNWKLGYRFLSSKTGQMCVHPSAHAMSTFSSYWMRSVYGSGSEKASSLFPVNDNNSDRPVIVWNCYCIAVPQ